MTHAPSEVPWLENVESHDETAVVKVDPTMNEGSIVHTFGPSQWKCLQLDPTHVEEEPATTGLILKITKQTYPQGSGPGYVFVENVLDTFDPTEVPRSDPPEFDENDTESTSETTDKDDQSEPKSSDQTEYSPQNLGKGLNRIPKKSDADKMSDIDISKL
jgi:hypothetical protein